LPHVCALEHSHDAETFGKLRATTQLHEPREHAQLGVMS
jgi:hypothetical protein